MTETDLDKIQKEIKHQINSTQFDLDTLEADFKEGNSTYNLKDFKEILNFYRLSKTEKKFEEDLRRIRDRFQICFNHFRANFQFDGHSYNLIQDTDLSLELVILDSPLPINTIALSLAWCELSDVFKEHHKDIARECLLIAMLINCFEPLYEQCMESLKKGAKALNMEQKDYSQKALLIAGKIKKH